MIYFKLQKVIRGSIFSMAIEKRIGMRSLAALVDNIPPPRNVYKEKSKPVALKRKRIKYLPAEEILQQ
jgi:hypothetical protein